MLHFVEKSKLLKLIIIVFSLTINIILFAPMFIELNSTFAIVSCFIVSGTISIIFSHQIGKLIEEFISTQIKSYRQRHIIEFFKFIEADKDYKKILGRDTPIKNEEGEDIGEQTIYSALSTMKYDYFNTLD